jgi:glycosyltransferase involved in cell wall biosynthesis
METAGTVVKNDPHREALPARRIGRTFSYGLITSARNEAPFIESTIKSVLSQTVLPQKWIIVDDGSTDCTAGIVLEYTKKFEWIELLQMLRHSEHDYSAKAECFNAALKKMQGIEVDAIANIDADIEFEPDFFEFLLTKLRACQTLGIVGVPMREGTYDAAKDALFNEADVFGACQLFRRKCLEEIGGYARSREGGIDWIAVRTARMKGWETRSFLEKRFFHHRAMGTTASSKWRATVKYGRKDYLLGNHPLWELFRVMYQMTRKPYVVNGLLLLGGYSWAFLTHAERPISSELLCFNRREQLRRLKSYLRDLCRMRRPF